MTMRLDPPGSSKFILTFRKSATRSHRDSPGCSPGEGNIHYTNKPRKDATSPKYNQFAI